MAELTVDQYNLVYTLMTGALACLAGALLYFVLVRSTIGSRYHPAMAVASVVVGIAALHYLRIVGAWSDAYELVDGTYLPLGPPFPDGLRYIDWLVTVPLLLTELVLVLRLDKREANSLMTRLSLAAVAMIALGYPGEVSDSTGVALGFWLAGCIPFAYIIYVLWVELSRSLFRYSDMVALTVARARSLLVLSWSVYPVAYLFPILGWDDAIGQITRQSLYSVADVVSKVGFGLLVYRIARILTEVDVSGRSTTETGQVDLADAGLGLKD